MLTSGARFRQIETAIGFLLGAQGATESCKKDALKKKVVTYSGGLVALHAAESRLTDTRLTDNLQISKNMVFASSS
jgi:hypothetical protein